MRTDVRKARDTDLRRGALRRPRRPQLERSGAEADLPRKGGRHALERRRAHVFRRSTPGRVGDRAAQPPRWGHDRPRPEARCALGLGGRKVDSRDVDLLAAEEASLRIPGKPDHDLPFERLARGWAAEPRPVLRGRDVRLLAHALRPDHDVGQVEPDVREGGEELGVEAAGALMTLPAMPGLNEL